MRLVAAVLLALLLAGCASEPLVMRFDPGQVTAGKKIYFPPLSDEEVPRYVYVGELTGEQNFVEREGKKKNVFIEALKWIAGLFEGQEAVVLQRPQSGVVDENGRILITDVSRAAVFVFDPANGRLDVWEFAKGYRRFASPTGIALGPAGRVFVADADLKQVFSLDPQGNGTVVIDSGVLERPTGLAWDAKEGLLYVSDTQAHQIKVFDMTGRQVRTIGRRGEGPGEFNFPTFLSLSRDRLVVSDTMNARVQLIPLDGNGTPEIVGERGTMMGNLVRPKGVAVDSENNLYVIESYYDHLLIFDERARFLLPIGGAGKTAGSFYLPGGVWIDRGNRVFVADTFNGRISVFQFLGGVGEHGDE
ncbi:6-bladed beta-propeller [Dechloromonas sp. XY25]|uniref:6-bladed beta-propeller n=1 Tax=Dechloromonas hankyongensis TaxID=2908002 RepID=A0ABS9K1X2_9RHOO|nr:6-bladed beta-propeller [Dechloromonas hankyongensis]MCG2577170.1 6-bladed beta-propeller [Dechloromonas hankyongensis]